MEVLYPLMEKLVGSKEGEEARKHAAAEHARIERDLLKALEQRKVGGWAGGGSLAALLHSKQGMSCVGRAARGARVAAPAVLALCNATLRPCSSLHPLQTGSDELAATMKDVSAAWGGWGGRRTGAEFRPAQHCFRHTLFPPFPSPLFALVPTTPCALPLAAFAGAGRLKCPLDSEAAPSQHAASVQPTAG
mgnify:CR=1 FL=1